MSQPYDQELFPYSKRELVESLELSRKGNDQFIMGKTAVLFTINDPAIGELSAGVLWAIGVVLAGPGNWAVDMRFASEQISIVSLEFCPGIRNFLCHATKTTCSENWKILCWM